MQHAFSDEKRFKLWRKLWIALAESEMELGLNITPEQVAELKKYADDIDYEAAERYEREVRHDVMAHVKAYGAQAKSAMPGASRLMATPEMVWSALKVTDATAWSKATSPPARPAQRRPIQGLPET